MTTTWVRLAAECFDHPKQLVAGPEACWLWARGMGHCNLHHTDGFIASEVLAAGPGSQWSAQKLKKLVANLVSVGLWERADGGYLIHDYEDFQGPAMRDAGRDSERDKKRDRARDRQRKKRDRERDKRDGERDTSRDISGDERDPSRAGAQPRPSSGPVRSGPSSPPSPPAGGNGDSLSLFAGSWHELTGRSDFEDFVNGCGQLSPTNQQVLKDFRRACKGSNVEFRARVSARLAEDTQGFLLKQTLLHWCKGPIQAPSTAPRTGGAAAPAAYVAPAPKSPAEHEATGAAARDALAAIRGKA